MQQLVSRTGAHFVRFDVGPRAGLWSTAPCLAVSVHWAAVGMAACLLVCLVCAVGLRTPAADRSPPLHCCLTNCMLPLARPCLQPSWLLCEHHWLPRVRYLRAWLVCRQLRLRYLHGLPGGPDHRCQRGRRCHGVPKLPPRNLPACQRDRQQVPDVRRLRGAEG